MKYGEYALASAAGYLSQRAAKEIGSFWTRTDLEGALQAKMDLGLNPIWGNTAEHVSKIKVPKGTVIYEGTAGPTGYMLGGGSQIFIRKVESEWLIK